MYYFCTLFDSSYLLRGIALYESLLKNMYDFHLFIFAFDNTCYNMLQSLELQKVTIISLHEFEDEELLSIKNTRTKGEYCWTCTPSTILYVIHKYGVQSCTYIDADLYFYDSPEIIFEELGDKSILITEHRYTPKYDQTKISGKYCVQFMCFKNDNNGLNALKWWRDACIEWCYAQAYDGKFGDQKYLDDWMERFDGVHELKHLGGGVAPWNVQQYRFYKHGNKVVGIDSNTKEKFNLIFYHFHNLAVFEDGKADLGGYILQQDAINIIYKDYLKHLLDISLKIKGMNSTLNIYNKRENSTIIKRIYRNLKRKVLGWYNIVDLNKF